MNCFGLILLAVMAVFTMMTLIRWFELTAEAVDRRMWNQLALLVLMPFTAWLFPARVGAGRPTAVPYHEPVRGFGKVKLEEPPMPSDQPPPGTPREFLGMPVIPTRPKKSVASVDPDQVAKLRQKMKEQGMLGDD